MNITVRLIFNLLLVLLGVGFLIFSFFFIYKKVFKLKGSQETQVVSTTSKVTKDIVSDAKTKTYQEVKDSSAGVVVNPNVSNKEAKDKLIEEKVINANPENHFVVYDGEKLDPKSISIKQGDAVTFSNKTAGPINVVGKSGWGSALAVPSGKAFTQGFDFKGTYKYIISPASNVNGEVIVE